MVAFNPASLMFFSSSARGAHRSRRDNRQNRGFGRQARDAHGHVDQSLSFVLGEKNDLRLAGKRFDVGGVGEPARTHVAPDDFFQILFEEGNVALGHFDHARPVGMTAGNWSAKIRQAGRNHRSQVPRTVNPDLHVLSRPTPETRVRSGPLIGIAGYVPYSLSTAMGAAFQRTGGRCT